MEASVTTRVLSRTREFLPPQPEPEAHAATGKASSTADAPPEASAEPEPVKPARTTEVMLLKLPGPAVRTPKAPIGSE
jgi:hypothetical protein